MVYHVTGVQEKIRVHRRVAKLLHRSLTNARRAVGLMPKDISPQSYSIVPLLCNDRPFHYESEYTIPYD